MKRRQDSTIENEQRHGIQLRTERTEQDRQDDTEDVRSEDRYRASNNEKGDVKCEDPTSNKCQISCVKLPHGEEKTKSRT